MIIVGYDYGTTTSWLSVARDLNSPRISSMKSSLLIDGESLYYGTDAIMRQSEGIFINSPKKFIVNSDWDGFEKRYGFNLEDIIIQFTLKLHNLLGTYAPVPKDGEEVHITISIPNCYDAPRMNYMRKAMSRAFSQIYKDVDLYIYLLPEPVAAALHYANSTSIPGGVSEQRYVVTTDIGGGTTDLAVISLNRKCVGNQYDMEFKVLATESDGNLGGNDIDELLYRKYIKSLDDGENHPCEDYSIKHELIQAKETLSHNEQPIIIKDNISCIMNRGLIKEVLTSEGDMTIYRRLQDLSMKLKNKVAMSYISQYKTSFEWNRVLLLPIGGTMKIPYLKEIFTLFFEGAQMCEMRTQHDETYEGVMYGSLHYSGILSKVYKMFRNVIIEGRITHPISVAYLDNRLCPIVHANDPDGEYVIDSLRPLNVVDDSFHISTLRLYFREKKTITDNILPDYELSVNKIFAANGRAANNIPIILKVKIDNSQLAVATVRIENIDEYGGAYEEDFILNN